MIEKIKRWKFELDEGILVLNLYGDTGLINTAIEGDGKKVKDLVGWNIYSTLRMLFENNKKVIVHRHDDVRNKWQKLDTEKIKKIAYSPLEQ